MLSIFKKIIVFFLTLESRLIILKYKPKIIAVTGSVGKTSTKDAVYNVLSGAFFVRKSAKSFNSEIGVPLTIIGVENGWRNPLTWGKNLISGLALILFPSHYPKWLVLEVGADRPGDIRKISHWLHPDIVVLTRFSDVPVHVEFFDSPEDVTKEKGHLVRALKGDGVLVYSEDDKHALSLRHSFAGSTLPYGFADGNVVLGAHDEPIYEKEGKEKIPVGMTFKVDHRGVSIPIRVPGVLGRQHIYPVLAAIAVGISQGLPILKSAQAVSSGQFPPGRMHIVSGMADTVIIDDTYNSSPVAVHEALATLARLDISGRKIAVLGDMMELGKYSIEEHRNAGKYSAEVADLLITVGMRSHFIETGALKKKMGKRKLAHFEDSIQAGEYIKSIIEPGDIVLVKGSQSMRMERVVEAIMANPDQKEKLLVRQDEEWRKR
ncbi:MAG: Mur ligase family protein [Patescibacteria group bacterium]|nr:Mur ligase family protein [bacterium]MDZ4240660.1 Mur ligase family protein [Patescibacteria group bacterium]